MTKAEVMRKLGIETDAELARKFNIGRWAVGQWRMDEPIPKARQFELIVKYPDLFPLPAAPKKGRKAA